MREKSFIIFFMLFLISINSVIVPPLGYSFSTPNLPLLGIIYLFLNKNHLLNNYHIFLLSFFNDLIMGTAIGSSFIIYYSVKLFFYFLKNKVANKGILFQIIENLLGITLYFTLVYVFIMVYYNKSPSMNYYLMSYLLTIFCFPIVNVVFGWIMNKKQLVEK